MKNILDFINLTKPRIVFLVLVTTYAAMVMAYKWHQPNLDGMPVLLTFWTLLGTGLAASGSAAYNCYVEREEDKRMDRTKNRPLPTGRISPRVAWIFSVILLVSSGLVLYFKVNWITALLALISFVSYIYIYTPMKRFSSASTIVGAIPGAIPPVMGWVAVSNKIEPQAVVLFAFMFLWQPPHFLALAIMKRKEYEKAGMQMLPREGGLPMSLRQMLLYSSALFPVSLIPYGLGMANKIYLWITIILGLGFIGFAFIGNIRIPNRNWARGYFFYSIIYLAVVFTAMVLDR